MKKSKNVNHTHSKHPNTKIHEKIIRKLENGK